MKKEKILEFFRRFLAYYYQEFGVFPEKDIEVEVGGKVVEIEIFDALPYTLSALFNFFSSEEICLTTATTYDKDGQYYSFVLIIEEDEMKKLSPLFE